MFNDLDRKPKEDKISREEFEKTGVGEAFGEADWNGDGVLNWEEFFGTIMTATTGNNLNRGGGGGGG